MPATTRSKSKQSHLKDFGAKDTRTHDAPKSRKDSASKDKQPKKSDSKQPKAKPEPTSKTKPSPSKSQPERKQSQPQSPSRKRKHPEKPQPNSVPASKKSRQQQQHVSTTSGEQTSDRTPDTKPIMINRSPVLQLWSACVARHLYPELSWSTSLAVGSAISTLCAVAKGKSIGTIEEREKTPEEKAAQTAQRRAAEAGADREVQVMGFRLYIKGQDVILQGKPKHGNEGALKAKFGGEENYGRAKTVMDDAITSWTGSDGKSELNAKAFHMYEEFRPSVQSGQGGWGKKGALELDRVREVVASK